MNYEQFRNEIKKQLEERLQKEVEIIKNVKNNGLELYGVVMKSKDQTIAHVLYLEEFFYKFDAGASMDGIIESIIKTYGEFQVAQVLNVDIVTDWERVKDCIVFKLINKEMNHEMLEEIPHKKVLDLVKTYSIQIMGVHGKKGCQISIQIQNKFLEIWGIDVDELDKIATENTERMLPVRINTMKEVIDSLYYRIENDDTGYEFDEIERACEKMYVISNSLGLYGAGAMLYKGVLKNLRAKIGKDLIVIPSSIHEILVLEKSEEESLEEMKEMVKEVNWTLEKEEILSDSVYVYDKENECLTYMT